LLLLLLPSVADEFICTVEAADVLITREESPPTRSTVLFGKESEDAFGFGLLDR
jgi:hypothetical protein